MEIALIMIRNGSEPRLFPLSRDSTVIGRRDDCDLRIPLSDVSRKHCKIVVDAPMIQIEDLGSSNGTFVNGQRVVSSLDLEAGDTIQIGPVKFVLQIDGDPDPATLMG